MCGMAKRHKILVCDNPKTRMPLQTPNTSLKPSPSPPLSLVPKLCRDKERLLFNFLRDAFLLDADGGLFVKLPKILNRQPPRPFHSGQLTKNPTKPSCPSPIPHSPTLPSPDSPLPSKTSLCAPPYISL